MAIGDPYFDKVVLACDFEYCLEDRSSLRWKLFSGGNAAISVAQSKFGSYSAVFDGSGDYIFAYNSQSVDFGKEDFTIDFWVRPSILTSQCLISKRAINSEYAPFWLGIVTTGKLELSVSTSGSAWITSTGASTVFTINTWHHVAVVRYGTTVKGYVNGVEVCSVNVSTSALYTNTRDLIFGGDVNTNYLSGYIDDLRITKGIARYHAAFSPPVSANPLYAGQIQGTVKDANGNFTRRLVKGHRRSDGFCFDAVLSNPSDGTFALKTPDFSKHYAVVHDSDAWITYLPFNGDNNSTLFPEWGSKTVTPYGNAKISTTQSKFGGASAYFDGTGDVLSIGKSKDLEFGTGDFTVECWIKTATVNKVVLDGRSSGYVDGPVFYINPTGKIACLCAPNNVEKAGTTTVTTDAWVHVAWVRNSGTLNIYVNGVLDFSGAFAFYLSGYDVNIGNDPALAEGFMGYIDDLRISKGVARYIANFTPPTVPHFTVQAGDPYWNNVVLGCHFNSGETPTFKDVATGKVLTANGNVAIVSTQSKFGGYSAYFDGNGGYLKVADSVPADLQLGSGDFTIDFWVYTLGTGIYSVVGNLRNNTGTTHYFVMLNSTYLGQSTVMFNGGGTNYRFGTSVLSANAWHHVAVTRVGSLLRCFIDGTELGSAQTISDFSGDTAVQYLIGASVDAPGSSYTYYLNGYLDDLRVTRGVARWVTNFTPPAAAFPEVLETYGQQNAMIFDHLTPV